MTEPRSKQSTKRHVEQQKQIGVYKGPETKISKEEIDDVLLNYDAGEISSIEDISTMFCPNRIVLAFKADGDLVNLKGLPKQEKDVVSYEIDIIELLKKEGIGVQQIIPTRSGSPYVEKGGTIYLAYKKLEGNQIKDVDQEVCHEFGVNMGKLHKALAKYSGHAVTPRVDETFRHENSIPEQVNSFPLRDEYEKLFAEFWNQIDREQLESQVIHGGVSTSHSFFVAKKFNAFIDWDYAHVGYKAYDAALFMSDMLIPKPELFSDFLKAYMHENFLNEEEKKSLYYFIKYRLLFNVKKYYFYDRTENEHKKGISIAQEMITAYQTIDNLGLTGFTELLNRNNEQDINLIVTDADLERIGFKGILHSRTLGSDPKQKIKRVV